MYIYAPILEGSVPTVFMVWPRSWPSNISQVSVNISDLILAAGFSRGGT
jgi:hypothetical protein